MKGLKVTTRGPNKHYHVGYINSEAGLGAISAASDGDEHVHELVYSPARPMRPPTEAIPPQIDMMTGMPMINPETGMPDTGTPADPGDEGQEEGMWIVMPGGEDGHIHELTDYVAKEKKVKESDKDILNDCYALWREGVALESDSRKLGRESEDFRKGKHWDDSVKREMEGLNRACLTINEVGPNIDTLVGYQIEQRTDIKFLPKREGDQRVADMLNIVVKNILDECYFAREESKVFLDQIVPGKGVFNALMDYNSNIQGDIKVERFPWDCIVYGPFEKEDLSDCEYEVRDRMFSIARLKQMFGKKAAEIQANFDSYVGKYPDVNAADNGITGTNNDYRDAKKIDDTPFTLDGGVALVDVQKKQFRLVQCTRKLFKEVTVIFNEEENFFFTAYDWKEKDVLLAESLPGFQTITQTKVRMRITRFVGSVLLSDENPADLPVQDFFTVPVFAYRQNGDFWGKVEIAKDPQREVNKRRSQAMDMMNRLGASVYYTEPDMFVTPLELENFKKKRSMPGAMFQLNDINRRPLLEEGAQFPVALVEIMQMDQENLQRLMNVVVAQAGANESGMLFLEKKKGRLTGNQFLFDNLSFAKQKLGKLLLALIQRYYPAQRLYDILNSQYSRQKFKVGGEDFSVFSEDEIKELIESTDILEHDVIVSESSFAPSTRIGIAMALFELMAKGAQIPPELPLEFIDMPADIRMKITDSLKQQAESMSQTATQTSDTEIKKTLLAKGQYTVSPEEAQGMGLVPATGQENGLAPAPEADNVVDNAPQADEYANNLASSLAG